MSTVTIGCKLPNGIAFKFGEKTYVIKGWNQNAIDGVGHGITYDFPAEVWEEFKKVYDGSKLLKNGIIFANESARKTKDQAKDQKDNKSGHEQLPKPKKGQEAAGALGESDER